MNKFIGLGNLTRDPKFREIKGTIKYATSQSLSTTSSE